MTELGLDPVPSELLVLCYALLLGMAIQVQVLAGAEDALCSHHHILKLIVQGCRAYLNNGLSGHQEEE